jgi:cytochrome c556
MKIKLLAAGIGMVLSMGMAAESFAQSRPATVVRQRQAAMLLQSKYFDTLGPMMQGKVPYDAALVARNAAYLDVLSNMAWDGFTPATQEEKSRALPEVFSKPAEFKQAQDNLRSAVTKYVAATKGGSEQTVKAAWGEVDKSCRTCHDNFRGRSGG